MTDNRSPESTAKHAGISGNPPTAGAIPGIVGIGLLGCGNVGGALVELLETEGEDISARTGISPNVRLIGVKNSAKPRPKAVRAEVLTENLMSVIEDARVDVVIELMGGVEPAGTLILEALRRGKPVVTANKELMATRGAELSRAAEQAGVDLLYEAAVGGAIPIIRPLRESLAGERMERLMGIVNGTTNFMLTCMSDDALTYSEALVAAQESGLAEADPSADVDGHDAAAKVAILASIAFGGEVGVERVYREGISQLSPVDIAYARRLGFEVKLLAVAERTHSDDAGVVDIAVRVHPAMVPRSHPLALVRGAFNAVFIEGGAVGELMLYGRGAGGRPTAGAVLGDLIDAVRNLRSGSCGTSGTSSPIRIRPMDDLCSQYYLSMEVLDRPGVLAAVAEVFGRHSVSIRVMEQVGLADEARLVFLTHVAREADVQATMAELDCLEVVERMGSMLRVVSAGEATEEGGWRT